MKIINALFITHKDVNRFKSIFGSSEYHTKGSKIWTVNNCKFKDRTLCNSEIGADRCPCIEFEKHFFGCYHYNDSIESILKNKKIRFHKVSFECTGIDDINLYYKDNTNPKFKCNLNENTKKASKYFHNKILTEECENCSVLKKCLAIAKVKDLERYQIQLKCFSREPDTNVLKYKALRSCYIIVNKIIDKKDLSDNYFHFGYDFWYIKDNFTVFNMYGMDIPYCLIGRIIEPDPILYLNSNKISGTILNDFEHRYN